MMKSPKGAGETAAEKKAREAEQKRLEASQLEDTQSLLRAETLRRMRRFGQLAGASTSLPSFIGSMGGGGKGIGGGGGSPALGGGVSLSGLQMGGSY